MIAREAGRGYSFVGAGQYYLHDKEAQSKERVAWTLNRNIPFQDPDAAMKWMAYTSINSNKIKQEAGVRLSGRKREKGTVYTYSLSWSPEETPDREKMINAAEETLEKLGLENHQAVFVAHNDTKHPHVHIIANLVNHNDGRVHNPEWGSRLKLSDWALDHEIANDKILCEQRLENSQERKKGKRTRYQEERHHLKETIQELYRQSDSGQAFQSALTEQGFTLAKGNRRKFVLVDENGKIYNLSRQLEAEQRKSHLQKLGDIDHKQLLVAQDVVEQIKSQTQDVKLEQKQGGLEEKNKEQHKQEEYVDRDVQYADFEQANIDAAIKAEKLRPTKGKKSITPTENFKEQTVTQKIDRTEKVEKQQSETQASKVTPSTKDKSAETVWKELEQSWVWDGKASQKRQQLEEQLQQTHRMETMLKEQEQLQEALKKADNFIGRLRGKYDVIEAEIHELDLTITHSEMRMKEAREGLEAELRRDREQYLTKTSNSDYDKVSLKPKKEALYERMKEIGKQKKLDKDHDLDLSR